jgi:hypothetical protein
MRTTIIGNVTTTNSIRIWNNPTTIGTAGCRACIREYQDCVRVIAFLFSSFFFINPGSWRLNLM